MSKDKAAAATATPQAGAATATATATETVEGPIGGLLGEIFKASRVGEDVEERKYQTGLIDQLVEEVMKGEMTLSADTESMLNDRIAQIDKLLSAQLNEIMHHEAFQKLEGSWRGLNYLVKESETGPLLKLRVMNVSKDELLKDMRLASEFDQSALFKKIYSAEYDMFGGEPYGALIGDYEFSKHPQDIELLKRISQVSAAAHAPFISAAAPQLFGYENYTEIPNTRDMSMIFETRDYDKWRAFRNTEDSRYVGLCLPRVLMRLPYGPETEPVKEFNYVEDVDGRDHKKYLWSNAAYAMGARLTDAFARYGWLACIRGVENGGLVRDLPVHTFTTDDGEIAAKCPTETLITERKEYELAKLGFMALTHCKNTDFAAFFSGQSCQKPVEYDTDTATANAALSAKLPYILTVSRFAHYLKAIARDKIGSFTTQEKVSAWLNRWIMNYVTEDPTASEETMRQLPLREARIDVEEDPRRPGCYRAVAYLRPHYQLEELTMSLRLVSELPARKGG